MTRPGTLRGVWFQCERNLPTARPGHRTVPLGWERRRPIHVPAAEPRVRDGQAPSGKEKPSDTTRRTGEPARTSGVNYLRSRTENLSQPKQFLMTRPDEIHLRIFKGLTEEISEPLAIIFENSCKMRESPGACKQINIVPIYNDNLEPRKIMEQIIKQSICKHLEDKVISNSQHVFIKNK
uniref:Reverse transcriptase domain-containing protein n=1 Tax=Chelonoidis abingdonii TaxID=106734 RepID=A0A8C0H656_CHEAB